MKIRKYDKKSGIERMLEKGEFVLDKDLNYTSFKLCLSNNKIFSIIVEKALNDSMYIYNGNLSSINFPHNDYTIYELYEEE